MSSNSQDLKILQKRVELLELAIKDLKSIDPEAILPRIQKLENRYFKVKDVFNIEELMEYIGLAKSTIYKLTSANTIPYYKQGKCLFFERKKINQWLRGKYSSEAIEDIKIEDLSEAALSAIKSSGTGKSEVFDTENHENDGSTE